MSAGAADVLFADVAAQLLDAASHCPAEHDGADACAPEPPQPPPRPGMKSCLRRESDSYRLAGKEGRRVVFGGEEANATLLFVSPYDKDALGEWFYSEEDFEDFEADANGKKRKKKGKRKRATPAKASPAQASAAHASPAREPDAVTAEDLQIMAGVLFPAASADEQNVYQLPPPPPASAAAAPDCEMESPAKRRVSPSSAAAASGAAPAASPLANHILSPTAAAPSDPLAAAASAAAAAATGLANRRPASVAPSATFVAPAPLPPPTTKAPAAPADLAPMRTRREVRLLSEVNQSVDDLKHKIREVASARRERIRPQGITA